MTYEQYLKVVSERSAWLKFLLEDRKEGRLDAISDDDIETEVLVERVTDILSVAYIQIATEFLAHNVSDERYGKVIESYTKQIDDPADPFYPLNTQFLT